MGLSRSTAALKLASQAFAGVTMQMHHRMTIRKILMTGLLAIGILAAAVVLFFAGDHDELDQDGAKPTITGAHHPSD